jgi:hypothetical protein
MGRKSWSFGSEKEWKEALSEQNQYLKDSYEVDLLDGAPIDVQGMNESAGWSRLLSKRRS